MFTSFQLNWALDEKNKKMNDVIFELMDPQKGLKECGPHSGEGRVRHRGPHLIQTAQLAAAHLDRR